MPTSGQCSLSEAHSRKQSRSINQMIYQLPGPFARTVPIFREATRCLPAWQSFVLSQKCCRGSCSWRSLGRLHHGTAARSPVCSAGSHRHRRRRRRHRSRLRCLCHREDFAAAATRDCQERALHRSWEASERSGGHRRRRGPGEGAHWRASSGLSGCWRAGPAGGPGGLALPSEHWS